MLLIIRQIIANSKFYFPSPNNEQTGCETMVLTVQFLTNGGVDAARNPMRSGFSERTFDSATTPRCWQHTLIFLPRELRVKQEMKCIEDAIHRDDGDVLAEYGGFGKAMQRFAALHRLPEARVTEGATIDDHLTCRATRFAGSPKNLY